MVVVLCVVDLVVVDVVEITPLSVPSIGFGRLFSHSSYNLVQICLFFGHSSTTSVQM